MTGDFTTSHHTRSQGPPPYTEMDTNTSTPMHSKLDKSGKFLTSSQHIVTAEQSRRRQGERKKDRERKLDMSNLTTPLSIQWIGLAK